MQIRCSGISNFEVPKLRNDYTPLSAFLSFAVFFVSLDLDSAFLLLSFLPAGVATSFSITSGSLSFAFSSFAVFLFDFFLLSRDVLDLLVFCAVSLLDDFSFVAFVSFGSTTFADFADCRPPLVTLDFIGFLFLRRQAKQNQRPFCGLLTGGSRQFGWNTEEEEK